VFTFIPSINIRAPAMSWVPLLGFAYTEISCRPNLMELVC
jgi:hypothetical protein